MGLIRSFLFVPGNSETLIRKAFASGADALILDLEDAVAVQEKGNARTIAAQQVREGGGKPCYLRINGCHTPWHAGDLQLAAALPVAGVVLPKAEDPEKVRGVAGRLPPGHDVILLVETALGVLQAYDLARCSDRISRLAFGALDFTRDVGACYGKSGRELLHARSHLVIASRAAGILPPVDTVNPDLNDPEGLLAELKQVKDLGMFGKLAIHPKQVPAIHQAFTPTAAEQEEAAAIVERFEAAEKEGVATIEVNGRMVDYPVVAKARRVLELARLRFK